MDCFYEGIKIIIKFKRSSKYIKNKTNKSPKSELLVYLDLCLLFLYQIFRPLYMIDFPNQSDTYIEKNIFLNIDIKE